MATAKKADKPAVDKIDLTPEMYKIATALFDLGADKAPIPKPENLKGTPLATLVAKKIIERTENEGHGRAATPGKVKLLKTKEQITDNATPRAPSTGAPKSKARATKRTGVVTIEALERFVADFKAALKSQATESAKSADSEVKAARTAVANASTDDDLQNANTMLTAALKAKLDTSKRAVQAVVGAMLKDDAETPLVPVLKLMQG